MTEIEKFENLKFLSETHRLLHEKRQKYEWKIIFTSLTFYVASVGAVYTQKVNLPTGILISCLIWTIFLSFAFVTVGFLWSVHTANARNKSFAEHVETQIIALANGKPTEEVRFALTKFRRTYWAFYWQGALIIILAIAAATILTCLNPAWSIAEHSVALSIMPNRFAQGYG